MSRRQREARERTRLDYLQRILEAAPDRMFSKGELAGEMGITPRSLDRYASRLRRRLGDGRVVNCWGIGYRLNPETDK